MHPRLPRTGLRILLLALAAACGCADYTATTRATRSIYSVNVVANAAEVRDCRLLGRVNSRDESKCGLTVQPTPEECLRYQVRRAGGDTLLINGPIGDAYDCSGGAAAPTTAAATAAAATPAATPSVAAPLPPTAEPAAAPAPPTPATVSASSPPSAEKRARVVSDRGAARGCVYVGDLDAKAACESGTATEDCLARRGGEAGADMVVWDAATGAGASVGFAQLFRCNAAP
jgi:hypothetical protein